MEVHVVGDISSLGKSGSVSLNLAANATVDAVMQAIEHAKGIPRSKQVHALRNHCLAGLLCCCIDELCCFVLLCLVYASSQRIYHDGRLLDNRSLKLSTLSRWEGRPLKLYVMVMDKDCVEFSDPHAKADENRAGSSCILL